jgi:centrosomal CEP192-like protein
MPAWFRVLAVLAVGSVALAVPTWAQAGTPPSLSFLSSPSPAYGSVAVGQSLDRTFTLKNTGGSSTAALQLNLSGATAFTIPAGGDQCSAVALGPKKKCTVTVRYTPASAGASDIAWLSAVSKKPAASAALTLTGESASSWPAPQCWAPTGDGYTDVEYLGPANTYGNALIFSTVDGSCTGPSRTWTFIQAPDYESAIPLCQSIVSRITLPVDAISGWPSAPTDAWWCVYE